MTISGMSLKAVGVLGQTHGATLLDAEDQPLRSAILWSDGGLIVECELLKSNADFRGIDAQGAARGMAAYGVVVVFGTPEAKTVIKPNRDLATTYVEQLQAFRSAASS